MLNHLQTGDSYAYYLDIDDKIYINRRREYIDKFINVEKFLGIMNNDDYNYIINEMVKFFCKSQHTHQIHTIVDTYGYFEAMRLYKKVNRRLFKATEIDEKDDSVHHNIKVSKADRRDYIELGTPIIIAWTKNLYSIKKMNNILKKLYEKYYTEAGKEHRLNTYNKNFKKATAYKKAQQLKLEQFKQERKKNESDYSSDSSDSDFEYEIKVNSDSENSDDE